MSMLINGEEIESRFEIWSVRQKSSDGFISETACPEGEQEARLLQKGFGGVLWKRTGYATFGEAVAEESDAALMDIM